MTFNWVWIWHILARGRHCTSTSCQPPLTNVSGWKYFQVTPASITLLCLVKKCNTCNDYISSENSANKCLADWYGRPFFSTSCDLQQHVAINVLTHFQSVTKAVNNLLSVFLSLFPQIWTVHTTCFSLSHLWSKNDDFSFRCLWWWVVFKSQPLSKQNTHLAVHRIFSILANIYLSKNVNSYRKKSTQENNKQEDNFIAH